MGYLRHLFSENSSLRSEVAAEMVRTNLDAQWPLLRPLFYVRTDLYNPDVSTSTFDEQRRIVNALGEEPHTLRKLQVVVEILDDPAIEGSILGYTCDALNAIAGYPYASQEICIDGLSISP